MSKVTTRDLIAIQPLLERIEALVDHDLALDAYLTGSLTIEHSGGYIIGVAIYQDDQWWVDFTTYGTDT